VYFSVGGQYYNGESVHFSYMPDPVMEHARDVTIKLHHRVGRYVQLQLYFASKWIMLSEVSFISGKEFLGLITVSHEKPSLAVRIQSWRARQAIELRCFPAESTK
jgi:hypothetical protein